MKTIKYSTFLLTVLIAVSSLFTACKKDDNVLSKATFLPDVQIVGDAITVILKDSAYTEKGAVATENNVPIEYTISGSVDNTTPGVYILNYLGVNADGFSASDSRTVIVLPEAFIPGSAEISGNYKLASNSRPSTVTKVVDGVYTMSDGWGTATSSGNPSPIFCYLFCTDGVNITMPNYPTIFGGMEGTGTYDGTKMVITTTLVDQGPLTRVRTWNKQ